MAWASKKQYAILMNVEGGKDLAENLADMEQEEFNKEFGRLLGKSNTSSGDYDGTGNKKQYKKSFAERDKEEMDADLEAVVNDENISQTLDDNSWASEDPNDVAEKTVYQLAEELGVEEFSDEFNFISQRVYEVMKKEQGQFERRPETVGDKKSGEVTKGVGNVAQMKEWLERNKDELDIEEPKGDNIIYAKHKKTGTQYVINKDNGLITETKG